MKLRRPVRSRWDCRRPLCSIAVGEIVATPSSRFLAEPFPGTVAQGVVQVFLKKVRRS